MFDYMVEAENEIGQIYAMETKAENIKEALDNMTTYIIKHVDATFFIGHIKMSCHNLSLVTFH